MKVREETINIELSRILNEKRNIHSIPEAIEVRENARRMPDLTIKPLKSSLLSIFLEAKIGGGTPQRKKAFDQALSHMKSGNPDVFASMALCYPEDICHISKQSDIAASLRRTNELHFAGITNKGQQEPLWHVGGISELSSLIRDIESGDLIHLNEFVQAVNQIASKVQGGEGIDQKLADALKVTVPKNQKDISKTQVIKIASLIWLNAAMMQIKIRACRPGTDKEFPDIAAVGKEANQSLALLAQWERILKIDYTYIFYPAARGLEAAMSSDNDILAQEIIKHARRLVTIMGKIKLDYAGPLYHRLLATAQNDGSFYTTTEASKILIELALPDEHPKWRRDNVQSLRIIDPACGTGTLLMSSLGKVKEKVLDANGSVDEEWLHKTLVEECLYGCDINRHAVHLAACMLTFPDPGIDYRNMNLYRFNHGKHGDRTYAGSLEILGKQRPGDALFPQEKNILAAIELDGRASKNETTVGFHKNFDIVVMNPPYTRNSLRNHHHKKEHHKAVDKREQEIVAEFREKDGAASESIRNSSIQTYFPALADYLLRDDSGIMASVMPTTVCSGTDALPQRKFIANRFHIEAIVTSHDPGKKNFSGKTGICESLLVARKGCPKRRTKFINLHKNPNSILEAKALLNHIKGNKLEEWGNITEWPNERMLEGDWTPALFYSSELPELAREVRQMFSGNKLRELDQMAAVGPDGRQVRNHCKKSPYNKSSPYCAVWFNPASDINKIVIEPDRSIHAQKEKDKEKLATLWRSRSNLLLPHRVGIPGMKIFAAWCDKKCLGNAWTPVSCNDGGGVAIRMF